MLEKIPEIGEAWRAAFHWVPRDETIYLFMDNAGGHGTNDATAQYTRILWNKFKVEVVGQVPRSPGTNLLDLDIWMSIQAAVTRVHHKRRCHHDALARSVVDAWNNYLSPDAFRNMFGRLRVVLSCIVEDGGGNSLVERKRDKLFRDATIVDLIAAEEEYVSDDEDFYEINENSCDSNLKILFFNS